MVKCCGSSGDAANREVSASNARNSNVPPTRMSAGPCPDRSKAMVVPSLDVTVFMCDLLRDRTAPRQPDASRASPCRGTGSAGEDFVEALVAFDDAGFHAARHRGVARFDARVDLV